MLRSSHLRNLETGWVPSNSANDAINLLTSDHKDVKALFKQCDQLVEGENSGEEKQALAEQICQMMTVHVTVEEELFYPAAREVLGAVLYASSRRTQRDG